MSNTGNYNTGDRNTGYYNTGDYNTGDRNTGYYNTGDYNTGDYNTGNYNTGDRNTGDCNTGDYNTGDRNTGDCNTGYYNTGNYNTGDRNTGDCNTDTPKVRLFNKDSGWEFFGVSHNRFRNTIAKYLKLKTEWVYEKNMTDKEKSDNPSYKTTGGYLKVNRTVYNGKTVSKEDREFLESVPNFCPKILEETTGIVLGEPKKKITIDGKSIELSQESFEALKKSLLED